MSFIAEKEIAGVLHLALEGSLEAALLPDFKDKLFEKAQTINKILINFERVSFIDSTCLGAILALSRELAKKRGKLVVCEASSEVLAIFQMTRLDKIIHLCDDKDEAIKTFK